MPGTVELRNEISRVFTVELPGTLVYDYPTCSAIADLLVKRLTSAAVPLQSGSER